MAADNELAKEVIEKCTSHAYALLALQLPAVEAQNYDFTPAFRKMITELYLVGVMWRFGEQFDLPTHPRDRAFICLMQMLIDSGVSWRAAKRHIRRLNSCSRDEKGEDSLALRIGYEVGDREGALVAIMEKYRNTPAILATSWRVIEISKPIAVVIAISGIGIALLLGRSWVESFGVGLVAGIAVIVTASIIFRKMTAAK